MNVRKEIYKMTKKLVIFPIMLMIIATTLVLLRDHGDMMDGMKNGDKIWKIGETNGKTTKKKKKKWDSSF